MGYGRSILAGGIIGALIAISFAGGFLLRGQLEAPVLASSSEDYSLLLEAQALLDQHYLRPQPQYQERVYAAIRGLFGSLEDRNTFFIEPVVAQSEAQVLAGTYGGIGVEIKRNTAGNIVLYPFAENAASRAGVLNGDILVAINGILLESDVQQDAVDQMLRGEVRDGNGVEITIERNDSERVFFIPFEVINVPSVIWRQIEGTEYGYIHILRFTNRTPDELESAITELRDAQGLVLDFRDNSGGLLAESIEVASAFLAQGVVAYEQNTAQEKTYEAQATGEVVDIPIILIVNNRTASASELVVGALVDNLQVEVVGQQTYGKGTVQQIFSLSDGSSVHITASEWFTPLRRPIDGVGLAPTILVEPSSDGQDRELAKAVELLGTITSSP